MSNPHAADDATSIDMPKPTAAPLVLALAIALLAAGWATSAAFLVVGGVLFVFALAMWIGQLLPGRGHWREPRVALALRPEPIEAAEGKVERMRVGMPGYRMRLPTKVHPISAGIKGGIVGGLVMPVPALAYGVFSGHGIWYPINLLAGMVLPGVGEMSVTELEQQNTLLLIVATLIHITVSLTVGLIYGVLMPTLPRLPRAVAWGAVLMPLAWTAACFIGLGYLNPPVRGLLEWPWFVVSQFIFGVVAAIVFMAFERHGKIAAGIAAGVAGGLLMPIPALLWGYFSGHGIWYPINLLSAMWVRHASEISMAELQNFQQDWLIAGIVVHAILCLAFGLSFALVLPRVPSIPGPLAWGGLVMPLLWTAMSYGLMGVVNPVLQERVDWPWFIASQFVFGLVAAFVVVRSEQVHIPPAGPGTDTSAEFPTLA
jgi:hypothetical protein